jgi:hypothetical protein
MCFCACIERSPIKFLQLHFGCRERDRFIIDHDHVRYALHHYSAKHPVCPFYFIQVGIQLVLINFIAICSCPKLHDMTYIIGFCLQGDEALFSFPNLLSNFTMQKEDSSSHQNAGIYIEY